MSFRPSVWRRKKEREKREKHKKERKKKERKEIEKEREKGRYGRRQQAAAHRSITKLAEREEKSP